MADPNKHKPHIFLGKNGKREPYTHPGSGGGSNVEVPRRNRQQHGRALQSQLQTVTTEQDQLAHEAEDYDLELPMGIQVEFESFPGVELAVESLADSRHGIELSNVMEHKLPTGQIVTVATVFVPAGKLSVFENKLRDYLQERKDKNGRARDSRKLIDAIRSFRRAALEKLWGDEPGQFPRTDDETFWWEVWLPVRNGNRQAAIHDFRLLAEGNGIEVSDAILEFPERSVLLARGNKAQFAGSGLLLNSLSELRRAKETAAFFDELPVEDQRDWVDDLLARLHRPSDDGPSVCILDTGVNYSHPLLQPFLDPADQFTIDDDWTGADDDGHGTGMAGLAVWGDLVDVLAADSAVRIGHRIESVKLLRRDGDNQDRHLGVVTSDGVSLPEIHYPHRHRLFTMAVSAEDGRDRGRPSAWSSTIDSLVVDYLGESENPRLFIIAAGNTNKDLMALRDYPENNLIQDIHDPGQAWNVITVGACTNKVTITESDCQNFNPLAPLGGLSPFSTTSQTWKKSTPIKPEVVFEGGNAGDDSLSASALPSLDVLTSHHLPDDRLFTTFRATSAATALASRFAASLMAQYPDLWPETVRGLMVHSAEWTDAMRKQFGRGGNERKKAQYRVRCVGFGRPDLERALWSTSNSLALIVEDELQPFEKGTGVIKTCDMHLHELPWPRDALQSLGDVQVEMKVTLSYFIEPSPSSRNVSGKYSYPSHQLRFDVKRPTESLDDFRRRINRQARDEEEGINKAPQDPNWMLGSQFRHKGSIHRDTWTGLAAELAEREQIVVYPATGWWRTRTRLQRVDKKARYALIVSISVPETDIDIYTEVENAIAIQQAT